MPDVFISSQTNQTDPHIASAEQFIADKFPQVPFHTKIPKPTGFFTTYSELPKNLIFESQNNNEIILLFLRRDFITNIPWIVATILLLIVPFLGMIILGLEKSPFSFLPANFALVFQVFYYLIIATYVFVSFITWFFNVSLVTNQRIIDIDFADVVYKNVSATKITEVEDVSFTQVGVIRTLFDFGDVMIQTAGTLDHFDFTAVPRPAHVVDIVESLIGKASND